MKLRILTANRLIDGRVVYLAEDGGWTEWFGCAYVIEDDREFDRLMVLAKYAEEARVVVGVYDADVEADEEGGYRPLRYREVIRAFGPSTHPEFQRDLVPPLHWSEGFDGYQPLAAE